MHISYLEAVTLSYELWIGVSLGYSKRGYIQTYQSKEISKYGKPHSNCWMCEWSSESKKVKCSGCPLSRCDLTGSLFSDWFKASCGGITPHSAQAMEAAEAIRDVFKEELDKLKGEKSNGVD